jgi:hypothetical protein
VRNELLVLGSSLVQKTKSLTLYRFANTMDDRKPFSYICRVHFTPKCIYIFLFFIIYIYRVYISGHSIVLTFGLVLSYPEIGGHSGQNLCKPNKQRVSGRPLCILNRYNCWTLLKQVGQNHEKIHRHHNKRTA